MSFSWNWWRNVCACVRTASAYPAASAGRSPGNARSRICSAARADPLDAAAALREPDVTETAPEKASLPLALRRDAERAEAPFDHPRVDALPVVDADELV
jgi:hypothetical protein